MDSALEPLATAHIADAIVALAGSLALPPPGLRSNRPGSMVIGPAAPVRHFGSVDVILERIHAAPHGTILVVDNKGRLDEGCVGDLVAAEAKACGLSGVVIFGAHRDSAAINVLGVPLWSLGPFPFGPRDACERTPDYLDYAELGSVKVTAEHVVAADDDGVVVFESARADQIVALARAIRDKEVRQSQLVADGRTLREQLKLDDYLRDLAVDPALTFREHLSAIGGAIET
jgi:4-hydroxy-4-methyl-2-oxoglutarate aldolase